MNKQRFKNKIIIVN